MSCWDGGPPGQIVRGAEFDREVARLRCPRSIGPAEPWPVLTDRTAGGVRTDSEHERQHDDRSAPGARQRLSECRLEIFHRSSDTSRLRPIQLKCPAVQDRLPKTLAAPGRLLMLPRS